MEEKGQDLGRSGELVGKEEEVWGRGGGIYTLQGKAKKSPHFPNGAWFGRRCLHQGLSCLPKWDMCLPSTASGNPVAHTSPRQCLKPFPIGNFDIGIHKLVGLGAYYGMPCLLRMDSGPR